MRFEKNKLHQVHYYIVDHNYQVRTLKYTGIQNSGIGKSIPKFLNIN